jgi:hypothetical protein
MGHASSAVRRHAAYVPFASAANVVLCPAPSPPSAPGRRPGRRGPESRHWHCQWPCQRRAAERGRARLSPKARLGANYREAFESPPARIRACSGRRLAGEMTTERMHGDIGKKNGQVYGFSPLVRHHLIRTGSKAMLIPHFLSLTPIWANTNMPTSFGSGCGAPQASQFAGFNSVKMNHLI